MQGQFTSGTSSISQKAALAALTGTSEESKKMIDSFLRRRNMVFELMKEIPGMKINLPEGAFYFFPDVSYYFGKTDGSTVIKNPTDFCMYLLKDAKVSMVTGEAFGNDKCVRFSYATSDDLLKEAIVRIKESLKKLK